MSAQLDVLGTFWRPEHPERRVPGHLTFGRATGFRLRLQEPLGGFDEDDDSLILDHRVVGEAAGTPYTLERCFQRAWSPLGGEQVLVANHVLVDAQLEADEQPMFSAASFMPYGLGTWLGRTGLRQDAEATGPTVVIDPVRPVQLDFGAGRMTLTRCLHVAAPSFGERRITEQFEVRVYVNAPVPLQELVELAGDFQDLLSMGCHRTCGFDELRLYRSEDPAPVTMLASWIATTADTPRFFAAPDCAFTFDDIGGAEGIARWMDLAGVHRSALGHVMGTRYLDTPGSDRLIHRCAALERIARGPADPRDITLAEALARHRAETGADFEPLIGDWEIWANALKGRRNEVAHQFGRFQPECALVHYLAESAYWFFVVCTLRMAGFPPAATARLRACPAFVHDLGRLRRLLRSGPP